MPAKKRTPRIVVDYTRIFGICETLFQKGERVSMPAVRAALGGGSPNVIYPHIKAWNADHLARFRKLEQAARAGVSTT